MHPEAKRYAVRIMDAYVAGEDSVIVSIHQEIVPFQDLYLDVWSQFPASLRRALKEIICDQ